MGHVISFLTCSSCVRPSVSEVGRIGHDGLGGFGVPDRWHNEAIQQFRARELEPPGMQNAFSGYPQELGPLKGRGPPNAGGFGSQLLSAQGGQLQARQASSSAGLPSVAAGMGCILCLLLLLAALATFGVANFLSKLRASAPASPQILATVPKPTEEQLALLDVGLSQFVHYDINPWSDPHVEHNCAERGTMDCLPAKLFNPTNLSTDQWVQTAVAFGAKEICLTAHHESGFALWPTNFALGYSVASSRFKGDVVRQFADSCKRHGVRICYYFGPNANGWLYQKASGVAQFLELQHKQLSELLTQYGPVARLWWDHYLLDGEGGCNPELHTPCPQGSFPEAWGAFVEQVRRESPNTLICPGPDCVGHLSEMGMGAYPVWLTCLESSFEPGGCLTRASLKGGNLFMPRETCVTPTHSGWFADGEGDQMAFSLANYWRHYLNSVGIGMISTVNAPPGTTGQIHPSIANVMRQFGAATRPIYHPDASAGPAEGDCASLVVELDIVKGFNMVISQEDLRNGQRIAAYSIEAQGPGGAWAPVAPACAVGALPKKIAAGCVHGLSVGAMVIDVVDRGAAPSQKLRFRCLESLQDPVYLKSFSTTRVSLPSELL